MTLQVTQSVVAAGTTPTALTPAATDTIAAGSFGPNGLVMRLITTGTATNLTVVDPGFTDVGNAGTSLVVAAPATGVRMVFLSTLLVNTSTLLATIQFSGALTGVTYELYRV